MSVVTKQWEHHPSYHSFLPIAEDIAEQIKAAAVLGLTQISVTTKRQDHFMQGGNVVKGKCLKYTFTAGHLEDS